MFSDGGLQPEPFRRGVRGRDGFTRDPKVKTSPAPAVSARLVKGMGQIYYPPDGTGRDTYIIQHHGGTVNEKKHYNFGFIKMEENKYLRDRKNYNFSTPRTDALIQ